MARSPRRSRIVWNRTNRTSQSSDDHASLHRIRKSDRSRRIRTSALLDSKIHDGSDSQKRNVLDRFVLRLFVVFSNYCLQGDALNRTASTILRRPARPGLRKSSGDGSLAIFNQHIAQLVQSPTASLDGAQRRNQYASRKPKLDHRSSGIDEKRNVWGTVEIRHAGHRNRMQ